MAAIKRLESATQLLSQMEQPLAEAKGLIRALEMVGATMKDDDGGVAVSALASALDLQCDLAQGLWSQAFRHMKGRS